MAICASCSSTQKSQQKLFSGSRIGVFKKDANFVFVIGLYHIAPKKYYENLRREIEKKIKEKQFNNQNVLVVWEGISDRRNYLFDFDLETDLCKTKIKNYFEGWLADRPSEIDLEVGACALYRIKKVDFVSVFDVPKIVHDRIGTQVLLLDPFFDNYNGRKGDISIADLSRQEMLPWDFVETCGIGYRKPQGYKQSSIPQEFSNICFQVNLKVMRSREEFLEGIFSTEVARTELFGKSPQLILIPWGEAHYENIEAMVLKKGYEQSSLIKIPVFEN